LFRLAQRVLYLVRAHAQLNGLGLGLLLLLLLRGCLLAALLVSLLALLALISALALLIVIADREHLLDHVLDFARIRFFQVSLGKLEYDLAFHRRGRIHSVAGIAGYDG